MKCKICEAHQNFLIIEGEQDFVKGLLFPHNIVFDGEDMSLPFAMSIMKHLRENDSLLNDLKIIDHFGLEKEHVILSYDCRDLLNKSNYEKPLVENQRYKGRVIAKTKYSTIIAVNGYYGYVDGINNIELDAIVYVAITRECRNRFGFYKFCIANSIEEDISIDSGLSEKIEDFLSKKELEAIENNDREIVEWVLNNIEGTTRKNINVVREVLHLTYNPNYYSDLARFISERPQYFTENNFWLGGYRDKDTNDTKLIIYDCNDVVLEIQVNESGMWVKEFSHDRNKSNAQYLLNINQKALIISGCNLIFHENSYLRPNNLEIGQKILNQLDVARNIIPKLKIAIRAIKEKAGIEYLTLKDYLTYQENKEKEYYKKNVVSIAGNEATTTTSVSNGRARVALFLNKDSEVSSLFTEQDEDVCHIEITNDSVKIKAELKQESNGYCINFYNEHLNIGQLREEGFELRRRAGVKHLLLQKESIDYFVYGEEQFDLFEKLNRCELVSPMPDDSFDFFDSKFVNVEEGNNQPLAIRKAVNVNDKDIFLIQGPPGTGKTSVIVEIIKQLVINRGEKVLVCSQAHSAVKNIYDRLNNVDERIKIGNIDEEETMIPDDLKEHPDFLKNNELLLRDLESCDSTEEISNEAKNSFTYKSSVSDLFKKRHEYICKYYTDNKPNSTMEWIDILSELRKGLIDLGDDAKAFNNARHYQGLNVVMGTCIGVGMNNSLLRSGVKFDTVIIDEAGKANLSETTVPMKLGRKYILVGDNKQLPPFMDTENIAEFVYESGNESLSKKDVENAISTSLFEDFLEDSNFPKESSILLNYQYRMNPDIGAYISELFYEEALKNGKGTEKQVCNLESFPSAVTFIDTSSSNEKAYEKGNSQKGWYNLEEISIFKERLLPRLEELIAENSNISVGIITPYRQQRALFMEVVQGTSLDNSVYTIDSIQGSEFDIVILSLVRAFNPNYGNKTVGFLDDMRRLNVALSRAKKKLIIIGNLDTLTSEKAHDKRKTKLSVNPIGVFQKLRSIQDRTVEKTSLDVLMNELKNNRLVNGAIFKNCTWRWKGKYDDFTMVEVNLDINGILYSFPMKTDKFFLLYGADNQKIDVQFLRIAENGRAMFRYKPNVSISEMIEDMEEEDVHFNKKARIIDKENDYALFEFEDNSKCWLSFDHRIKENHILWDLLKSKYIASIPLFIQSCCVKLDSKPYSEFGKAYKEGDKVSIKVIDDICSEKYYIVKCGEVYGKVNKLRQYRLKRGQEIDATIFRISKQSISFNII